MDETAYCSIEPDFDVGRDKRADVLSFDGGFFAFDGTEPLASSGNKLVYPGTYTETAGRRPASFLPWPCTSFRRRLMRAS